MEADRLPVAVEKQQERVVDHRPPVRIGLGDGVSVEEHGHRVGVTALPVVVRHLARVRAQPHEVGQGLALVGVRVTAEEAAAAQHRVGGSQGDGAPGELHQLALVLVHAPVGPGDLVVLAVGVVVPLLGAAQFVAVGEHGDALGEQQRGEEVALLPAAQFEHAFVVGGAFGAAVPGPVGALAVPVVLAVGLVALVVVRDQVAQGESVVGGDEVDAGARAAAVVLVEVGGAGEPGGELGEGVLAGAPEVPYGVAVLAVPLRPLGRELADLVAALADVPWLCDELDAADHRVLLDEVEEGGEPVHLVELPGKGGREVEPEAVDVHLGDPVPQ
ncbi:hypothetical protein GCM10009646_34600 [Streptomyces aureus]